MRPCNRPTARVSDHSGEIADDENCLMPEVLKLPQFSQNNCVPKVNIRRRRVDPKLDAQFTFIDDLRRAFFQKGKSFVRLHNPVREYRACLGPTSVTYFCSTI